MFLGIGDALPGGITFNTAPLEFFVESYCFDSKASNRKVSVVKFQVVKFQIVKFQL